MSAPASTDYPLRSWPAPPTPVIPAAPNVPYFPPQDVRYDRAHATVLALSHAKLWSVWPVWEEVYGGLSDREREALEQAREALIDARMRLGARW